MNDTRTDSFDALLGCLAIVCKLENMPFSEQVATAGLPIEKDGLTPGLFERAARKVGLTANLGQRPLAKISHLVLPAVLIMQDNNACVLTSVHDGLAEVYFPENPNEAKEVSLSDLKENYSGYIIYVAPHHQVEMRAESGIKPENYSSWFWGVIFSYKSIFLHVLIAAFLTNLFVLVIPIYIMNVYDRVIPTQSLPTLWMLTIGAVIFFLFDFLARVLRGYLIDTAGRRADIILASELFEKLMNLRMRQKPGSTGAFSNAFNDFEGLREFFTSATLTAIIDIPFTLLFVAAIWFIGGNIVWIPLTSVVVVITAAFIMEIPTVKAIKNVMAGATQKNAVLVESLNGLETIKSIGAEGLMQRKWEDAVITQTKANMLSRSLSNLSVNFAVLIQQLTVIGVVAFGALLISSNMLTIGGLIACTILSGRVMMLSQIVSLSNRFARSRQTLKQFNELMQQKSERSNDHQYLHRPKLRGDIEFDDVTFIYPKRRINAVEHCSLSINAGEKIGIIGKIGAGKSTLLKLLVGLYQPATGSITVDGTDNQEIDPADLRGNIRYVASDSNLFYGTVKDNILMGARNVSDDAFMQATKISGVDSFIAQSPLGYDMPVGERGEGLSAGQRQAVILARALVANPPVLLLDEPTAGVDNNFEQELMKNIEGYIKDKTLLLVTHRLNMLKLVDRVIVMERGHIVADGPRDEILRAMKVGSMSNNNGQQEE